MIPGEGCLPLRGMLQAVEDHSEEGYGGYVTLELQKLPRQFRREALEAAKAVVPAGWLR